MSKTKILLLLALSFSSWACNKLYAQDPGIPATELVIVPDEKKPDPVKHDDDKIWTAVEQNPQFPGGDQALYSYIDSHLEYPLIAQEKGIQGRVVVQLEVLKDGRVGVVKVVRGIDPDLDKEAMRVVKTLPKFVPGKMNGHAVNVWYILPIQFKLANS